MREEKTQKDSIDPIQWKAMDDAEKLKVTKSLVRSKFLGNRRDDQILMLMNDAVRNSEDKPVIPVDIFKTEYYHQIYANKSLSIALEKDVSVNLLQLLRRRRTGSVTRTTFTLSLNTLDQISMLENDHNISATEVLSEISRLPIEFLEKNSLPQVSDESHHYSAARKTFTIDKSALTHLKSIAKECKLSRNMVVEILVEVFSILIEGAHQKERLNAVNFADKIIAINSSISELVIESSMAFGGGDHPLPRLLSKSSSSLLSVHDAIGTFLQSGIWEEE